ncbi:MAG: hypothetical protein GYA18_10815 [Chloroflexi bacterium]|nr:hypothetical protein [Chloroflexota bacterium]
MRKHRQALTLYQRFPPSEACNCEICRSYCARPGWWNVIEATKSLQFEFSERIMLEIAPERTFGVLSPAFKGCEGSFALQEYAHNGCTFLQNGLCELFGSGLQPLECRFCHHTRFGLGSQCHAALENNWKTTAGQALVERWAKKHRLWECYCRIIRF